MDPIRIEDYKGYVIYIYIWQDPALLHIGRYLIFPRCEPLERDAVKGGFVIAQDAEDEAFRRAKQWIDDPSSS